MKKDGEEAVEIYLRVLAAALQAAKADAAVGAFDRDSSARFLEHLQSGRMFVIQPDVFSALVHAVNEATGLIDSYPTTTAKNAYLLAQGQRLPLPEKLPFPSMVFVLDGEFRWSPLSRLVFEDYARSHDSASDGHAPSYATSATCIISVNSDGHVHMVNTGDTAEMRAHIARSNAFEPVSDGTLPVSFDEVRNAKSYWHHHFVRLGLPWIVERLIALVNENARFIVSEHGLSNRMLQQSIRKNLGLKKGVPKPYYLLKLKPEIVEEAARSTLASALKFKVEYDHRWDVRGHERVRVRRGNLPLPERLRKALLLRGYRIWTTDEPEGEVYSKLMRRHVLPKKVLEWMAIREVWVKPYVKGPEAAPYIPAARVLPQ